MLMNCINDSSPQALVQGVNAILQASQNSLLQALEQLRLSIQDISRALAQMHGEGATQGESSLWGQRAWELANIWDGAGVLVSFYGN